MQRMRVPVVAYITPVRVEVPPDTVVLGLSAPLIEGDTLHDAIVQAAEFLAAANDAAEAASPGG
jgi:hypothetical protein